MNLIGPHGARKVRIALGGRTVQLPAREFFLSPNQIAKQRAFLTRRPNAVRMAVSPICLARRARSRAVACEATRGAARARRTGRTEPRQYAAAVASVALMVAVVLIALLFSAH